MKNTKHFACSENGCKKRFVSEEAVKQHLKNSYKHRSEMNYGEIDCSIYHRLIFCLNSEVLPQVELV